jgi:hypothetical protein
VLHTGNVLLFSWPNKTVGSDAVLWNPVSGSITNIALSYQRDVFCSGMTALPDGRLFIAGGHIYQGAIKDTQGVSNTTLFDPASNAWTEGPTMDVPRWYPTTMQLGDGTVRIFAGTLNSGANAVTADSYVPSSNTRAASRPPSTGTVAGSSPCRSARRPPAWRPPATRSGSRHAVVATMRVGVRPYAVAADRQGAWVALLGQPVMHALPGASPSQLPAWLLRLCGGGCDASDRWCVSGIR